MKDDAHSSPSPRPRRGWALWQLVTRALVLGMTVYLGYRYGMGWYVEALIALEIRELRQAKLPDSAGYYASRSPRDDVMPGIPADYGVNRSHWARLAAIVNRETHYPSWIPRNLKIEGADPPGVISRNFNEMMEGLERLLHIETPAQIVYDYPLDPDSNLKLLSMHVPDQPDSDSPQEQANALVNTSIAYCRSFGPDPRICAMMLLTRRPEAALFIAEMIQDQEYQGRGPERFFTVALSLVIRAGWLNKDGLARMKAALPTGKAIIDGMRMALREEIVARFERINLLRTYSHAAPGLLDSLRSGTLSRADHLLPRERHILNPLRDIQHARALEARLKYPDPSHGSRACIPPLYSTGGGLPALVCSARWLNLQHALIALGQWQLPRHNPDRIPARLEDFLDAGTCRRMIDIEGEYLTYEVDKSNNAWLTSHYTGPVTPSNPATIRLRVHLSGDGGQR